MPDKRSTGHNLGKELKMSPTSGFKLANEIKHESKSNLFE
jgi:hypothetical protein